MVHSIGLTWRSMAEPDLAAVERIGDAVHPDYPEAPGVIAERLWLYPVGCFVLDGDLGVQGYAVAHPWLFGRPPPLNTHLGRLPLSANTLHIHDLAITPNVRSGGFGTQAVQLLTRRAQLDALQSMSLVAVGSSPLFWRRNGFDTFEQDTDQEALATYKEAVLMVRMLRQP